MNSLSVGQIIFITASAVLTVASLFFVPWQDVAANIAPLPGTLEELADSVTDGVLDGAIIHVATEGREPKEVAGGWNDRDLMIPARPGSLFRIASITKLYVAASLAMLVDRDVLTLDRTLASYLPDLADRIENSDEITLRMLVQHRSGIPDFVYNPEYNSADYVDDYFRIVDLVLDEDAEFEPDRRYRYSNTNFVLIGGIIDQALGYSYQQFIRDEILDPLELNQTYSSLAEIDIDELSSGYDTGWCCDWKEVPHPGPGGSMIATASDVAIFLRALIDGSLLSTSAQEIYASIYPFEHTGLVPGYSSIARYDEDTDSVIVVFVNTSGRRLWGLVENVYRRAVRITRRG